MLLIDKELKTQAGGVTYYRDHERFNVFYLLPNQPRYRRNPDGTPAFRFLKYRFPVDRPGDKKGGGFLMFDAEFVVDEAVLPQIREEFAAIVQEEARRRGIPQPPPVEIGSITYTKGETKLFVPGAPDANGNGTFVERLHNPGKPSLFGNNVTTFALELSQEGATFFEQAMQGAGGAVSIVYDLTFWAKLPPIRVNGHWRAEKFYSFYQSIDTEWHLWAEDSYQETVREQLRQSESMSLDFEWGGVTDEKVRGPIRDWAQQALQDAIERNMIAAIAPVPDDQRKAPDGIEDVTRDITSTKIGDVRIHYTESQTVEWNFAPQGILQNITELTDKDRNKLKWSDYSRTIDLDDPFFRQLRVDAFVNADFKALPIHSVEVKLLYKGRPMANLTPGQPEGEAVLNKEDAVGKFASYVEGDHWKYKYSYQVNYRGQSKVYQSPEVETNEGTLTIGVDDVGILAVAAQAGDLNWAEVDRALVTLKYEDDGVPPIEEQFQLTANKLEHKLLRVIFQPVRKNYRYRVKYFMKSGQEFEGAELEGRAQNLFINDVFGGRKTVSVRGVGDFANRVRNVFVNLEYHDAKNDYRQQKTVALNANNLFFDWTFPVVSATDGKVTYSATVDYKNNTREDIPPTVADSNFIVLPPVPQDVRTVNLVPDLLDWNAVRLARVSLSYADPDNNLSLGKDFIFSPANKAATTWTIELKNKARTRYAYKATYYLTDGLQKVVGPTETADEALILDHKA